MNKKQLLAALLLVTNIIIFTMNSHEGSGWDSDNEQSRSPVEFHQTIQEHITKRELGPATREVLQLLTSIEENPHSSDALESLAVVEGVAGVILSLASFKGQSSTPVFRDLPERLSTLKEIIRCPSISPVRSGNPSNLDEDIMNNPQ